MSSSLGIGSLAGRCALVVGLGRTGPSVARHLHAAGARVRVCDRRSDVPLPAALEGIVERRVGDGPELLAGIDLVVPSPGVPASSPLLRAALERAIPVVGEIELAAAELRAPIVAITGTNGKSTTTALTGAMLEQAGWKTFVGGNLGTPLIEAVGLERDVLVVEVSSFQLEWVRDFHPRVAALLNVTDDHLDRHGDLHSYAAVKARLFARQDERDTAILNRDDEVVCGLAERLAARLVTFGSGPLDGWGAASRGEHVELCEPEGRLSFSLARCRLLGAHNRENIMAALLAARAMGAPPEALQEAIDKFAGLRHRMELVWERSGVRFVDDSKGTNVGALLRSLEGFADGSVVLIAGGLDKGGDFSLARAALRRKVRVIALYGRARGALAESWRDVSEISSHDAFADAVQCAAGRAAAGDVVLLSPACASMDQFTDYAARGDAFASLVRRL